MIKEFFFEIFCKHSLAIIILVVVSVNARQHPAQWSTDELNVKVKLSAASDAPHNYAKPEEWFRNTAQIANRQQPRFFKNLFSQNLASSVCQPINIKMATLPSSMISEQQISIPIFLQRLLI